jgi:hypothetical protein
MTGGGTLLTPEALQVIADTPAEVVEGLCAVIHPVTGRIWTAALAGDWDELAEIWGDEIHVVPA